MMVKILLVHSAMRIFTRSKQETVQKSQSMINVIRDIAIVKQVKLKAKSNLNRNSNWEFIKLLKKDRLHFILQKLSNSVLDFHFISVYTLANTNSLLLGLSIHIWRQILWAFLTYLPTLMIRYLTTYAYLVNQMQLDLPNYLKIWRHIWMLPCFIFSERC